jgi:hypothetical protein
VIVSLLVALALIGGWTNTGLAADGAGPQPAAQTSIRDQPQESLSTGLAANPAPKPMPLPSPAPDPTPPRPKVELLPLADGSELWWVTVGDRRVEMWGVVEAGKFSSRNCWFQLKGIDRPLWGTIGTDGYFYLVPAKPTLRYPGPDP